MDLHVLLRSLSLAGVELHYGGPGVIGTRADADAITPELEAGIEEHRQTLLSYLVFAEGDPLEIAERFAIQNEAPRSR